MKAVRIIFSRKGLDSEAGKMPSPLVDGRPVSICIPTKSPTATTYGRLGSDIAQLVSELSKGRLGADSACHLDPDIDAELLPRPRNWRGALGQAGSAQSHLDNQGVCAGDVFIFWGLFREAVRDGRWKFVGPKEHRIFGWLQVAEVLRVGADPVPTLTTHPWLEDHPHVRLGWSPSSTVYTASDTLRIGGRETAQRGWGVMQRGRRLTEADKSPSNWLVPGWLNPSLGGTGMTFHKPESFRDDGTLRAASRGQEFVADVGQRDDAMAWLRELIEEIE